MQYISNPKNHHSNKSFKEEYIELLTHYNNDYQEEYLFE